MSPPDGGIADERLPGFRAPLLAVWREHRAYLLTVGTYVAGSAIAWRVLGWPPPRYTFRSYLFLFSIPALFGLVYLFVERWRAERAGVAGFRAGWVEGWRRARRGAWSNERLAGTLLVLAVNPFLGTAFSAWKQRIPLLHPFTWDAAFVRMDRALFAGVDPWRITHAVFGGEWVTRLIDVLYLPSWALVQLVLIPIVAAAPPGALRRRFLVTLSLTWIIVGNVLATLFASVGPCFLGTVAGSPGDARAFAPLMQKLASFHASAPLLTIEGQEYLLKAATSGDRAGGGISAFPSMHVATVVVLWLAARHLSRRWAAVAFAYLAVVFVGSVHLGWHYAVDGIGAALCVAVLWWIVGAAVGHGPPSRARP